MYELRSIKNIRESHEEKRRDSDIKNMKIKYHGSWEAIMTFHHVFKTGKYQIYEYTASAADWLCFLLMNMY